MSPSSLAPPSIVLDARLAPPYAPPGLLRRAALLARIAEERTRVVVASAPTGYGTSVLLAQCAQEAERPVAWLSADAGDDDPRQLAAALAAAVGRVLALDPRVGEALGGPRPAIERIVLPGILNALGAGAGAVLVIDDLHRVRAPASAGAGRLPVRAPAGARPASDRHARRVAVPRRMRLEGGLLELGPADLAFEPPEVARFLRAAGVPERRRHRGRGARSAPRAGRPGSLAMTPSPGRPARTHGRRCGDYLARELLFGPAARGRQLPAGQRRDRALLRVPVRRRPAVAIRRR